jgi:hypothetical protein
MSKDKKSEPRPLGNIEWINEHECIVRTQAGFRKALKQFMVDDPHAQHSGYPTSYPSHVSFSTYYSGGGHPVIANCVKLSKYKQRLEKRLALVAKHLGGIHVGNA